MELMLLINKSPLAFIARYLVDLLHYKTRKHRLLTRPVVESPQEKEILQHLNLHGWAKLSDEIELPLRLRILNECMNLQQEYHELNQRDITRRKTIWNYLSDVRYSENKPDAKDPLVQYALSHAILNIVGSYLGELPWLRYVILTESVYQPGEISYSQKWHLDFDDARMLKLFIYLSDVRTSGDGPFHLIEREGTRKVRNSFIRKHLSDAEVFPYISADNVVEIYGLKLSSFFVDTSRVYHCGSRMAEGHSRLLYTALFTGFPSIYPRSHDTFTAGPDASRLVRQVLTPSALAKHSIA